MTSTKQERIQKRTSVVFGASIIILALVLALVARSVITGQPFPFTGASATPLPVEAP